MTKTQKICIALVLLLSNASCTILNQGAKSKLLDLGIDETYFRSLPVCQQINIYVLISPPFVDQGHFVTILPSWMDDSISKAPSSTVADCIAEEGERRLDLLHRFPEKRRDISLSVHSLVYIAYNNDLFGYNPVQNFVQRAICDSEIMNPTTLALLYYPYLYGYPEYYTETGAVTKMRDELCVSNY